VPFASIHIVGSHRHHVAEIQPRMRRFHLGEEHPSHPRVAPAKELAGPNHGHLQHQDYGEGLEFLSELLTAPLPRRGDTGDLAIVATVSSRQRTDDHALHFNDVEVPLLHRLEMAVADHRGPCSSSLLRAQRCRLLYLQHEPRGVCIKPRLDYSRSIPMPQQLPQRFLWCHGRSSAYGRQAPPLRFYWRKSGIEYVLPFNFGVRS
jgi:hypothetical protein